MGNMNRIFAPVGHGAFYIEKFYCNKEQYSIVYDCGSKLSKKKLIKIIENNFSKEEVINNLFISHFHSDHINGIEFLLERCTVKRVFLPVISNNAKLILQIEDLASGHGTAFTQELIKNPEAAIKKKSENTEVVYIENPPGELIDNQDDEQYDISGPTIKSGDEIPINLGKTPSGAIVREWVFVPYNHDTTEYENIKNLLLSATGESSLQNIIDKYPTDNDLKEKVDKDCKKSVLRNNENSMTLYSGPKPDTHFNWSSEFRLLKSDKVGCLYTGDYDAKNNWNQLKNCYRDYKDMLIVQIPHHGSKNNFNDDFLKMDNFFVISGRKNKNPPANSVLIDFINNRKNNLFVVTEDEDTKLEIIIKWS